MKLSWQNFVASTRLQCLGIIALSAGALGFALISQIFFGLEPCILCKYQRIPYIATTLLASAGYFMSPSAARRTVLLCALFFLLGAGVAGFHVGVEQKWWEGTSSCGSPLPLNASLEELERVIMAAPVVRCDAISFSFLGVSMAGYNFLLSLFFAGVFFKTGMRHR